MAEWVQGVAVALGSNAGDRLGLLREAVRRLEGGRVLIDLRCSHAYETPPERPEDGPPFLNGVVVGRTELEPRDMLESLLGIEVSMGRRRVPGLQGGPRPIDLDLVLFGDRVVREPGLEVPHPRFRGRGFVLHPLAEVIPEARDPVGGASIHSLLAALTTLPPSRAGFLRE